MHRRIRLPFLSLLLATSLFTLACGSSGSDSPTSGAAQTLTVVNSTGVTIGALFVRETAGAGAWLDVLGGQTIPPGQSYEIVLLDGQDDVWDLRVEDPDGAEIDQVLAVDITFGFVWTVV